MGILKNLIVMGLSAGLADRQKFVSKVSGMLEEYQQNPEKAEQWANTITGYMEDLKDDIRMQNNLEYGFKHGFPTKDMHALTKALQELTAELQKHKK
jgi:hypothetical protein